MNKPTLSVYLPTYNHAQFLAGAVNAIMTQSRPPDQLFIADDASTDHTPQIIASLSAKYPQINSIRNKSNKGAANMVPPSLSGDYIYGAASDDRVLPGFFAEALSLAERYPKAGIILGQIPTYDPQGRYLYTTGVQKWPHSRYATPNEFLHDCLESELASHSLSGATIYRQQALKSIGGFRPELGSWMDTFALRATGLKHGVCYLAQPCMAWRLSTTSLSQSAARSPRALWATINQAAALMRSPEFQHLFPAAHVSRWVKRYRFIIAEQYLLSRIGQRITYRAARSPFIQQSRQLIHKYLQPPHR